MAGPKKAATSAQKPAATKASAKPTKKVASRKTTAKASGSKKPAAKSSKEYKCTPVTDLVETTKDLTLSSEIQITPVENDKITERLSDPPVHNVPLKGLGKFLLDDTDDIIKQAKWWPFVVDERDIAGRFLIVRDVNVINGLDHSAMNAERVRKALLGAIRFGKPFVFDMMGSDLYDLLNRLFEEIQPGLMDMVLDRSILTADNFMKLVRESDPDFYQNKNEYDANVDRFVFAVLNTNDRPTGFSGKMMTVCLT